MSSDYSHEKTPLGQILIEEEFCTQEDVENALKEQAISGVPIGQVLVSMGVIEEEELVYALALQAGWEMIQLEGLTIPEEVIKKVSSSIAKLYSVVPVRMEGNSLVVAMSDNLNVSVLDDLRFILSVTTEFELSEDDIN